MMENNSVEKLSAVLKLLPRRAEIEISKLCKGRCADVSEIRIRAYGRCSVRLAGRILALSSKISLEEIGEIVSKLCSGAVYAYRDSILNGYVPYSYGIRVGVAGSARYEGGRAVGIEEISSLVFRLPTRKSELSSELLCAFRSAARGMIIYAPPGGGKTAALRSLSHSLGSGSRPERVCIIDEREEFLPEDFSGCEIDVLRGYKKRAGIEIATRTLSPDVIIIDEISGEDAADLALAVRCGVRIAACAHASSLDELLSKPSLKPLFNAGAFDVAAGIFERQGRRRLEVKQI